MTRTAPRAQAHQENYCESWSVLVAKSKNKKREKESRFSMKYVFLLFWLEKTKETWFSRTRHLRTI